MTADSPADEAPYDLIVIGAGIGGVIALHYARRAGLRTRVLERQSVVGGLWAQLPAWQVAPSAHTVPQVPQFFASVCRLASQPLDESMSQSWKPGLHWRTHSPFAQVPMALALLHAAPQRPQWARLLARSASQPFFWFASQSPNPGWHAVLTHAPFRQSTEITYGASLQAAKHPPHEFRSVRRLVSQPLSGLWSQSS